MIQWKQVDYKSLLRRGVMSFKHFSIGILGIIVLACSLLAGGCASPQADEAQFTAQIEGDFINPAPDAYSYYPQGDPHLVVNITAPPDGSIYQPCNYFDVRAMVTNTGDGPAWNATLTIVTNNLAKLAAGETATKPVGNPCLVTRAPEPEKGGLFRPAFAQDYTISSLDYSRIDEPCILPGESYEVGWRVHCEGPGDAIITVNPDGWIRYLLGGNGIPNEYMANGGPLPELEKISAENLESDSIVVHQYVPPSSLSSPCSQSLPTCPCHFQGIIITPGEVLASQPVTVAVNVVNPCEGAGEYSVALRVNGRVEESRMVDVGGNTAAVTRFTIVKNEPGIYTVDIGDQKASFTVVDSSTSGGGESKGVIAIIAVGVLAVIVVGLVLVTRRRSA
jgi:hypothetical protein